MKTWTNPTVEELEIKETAYLERNHSRECLFLPCTWCGGASNDCGCPDNDGDNTNGDQQIPDEGYGES